MDRSDGKNDNSGPEMMAEQAEECIARLAEEIHASLDVSINGVKAVMRLPAKGYETSLLLVAAIEQVLASHFQVVLRPGQKKVLERYESLYFSVTSGPGLPDRSVGLDFTASPPTLQVAGKPPKDGEDSYADIAFDWRKRSGTLNRDGTFDWRKINSVPSIREKEVIATVHDRTAGKPGMDCFGKMIKPRAGVRHQIRWVRECIRRDEEGEDARVFHLLAAVSGVVEFAFRSEDDPKTLEWVNIADTLKITGDIDYTLGNLESAASLDIEGNVRGNFNLCSDGHIHVSGVIEGQEVRGKSIRAELITNKCMVKAKDDVEAQSINNAEAEAGYIRIGQNASRAFLRAEEKILFDRGASLTGVTMGAKYLRLEDPLISGNNVIVLGENLFERAKLLPVLVEKREAEVREVGRRVKELVTAILTNLAQIEKNTKTQKSTVIRNIMSGLKTGLAQCFKTAAAIEEATLCNRQELSNALGDRNAELSILRKVEQLGGYFAEYNRMQPGLVEARTAFSRSRKELEGLANEIRTGLGVKIIGAKTAGKNAELKIRCGEAELTLRGRELSGPAREVRYVVADDIRQIGQGRLRADGA